MPGTSPDYWMAADDRVTATVLALLDQRAERSKARAKGGGRRGR